MRQKQLVMLLCCFLFFLFQPTSISQTSQTQSDSISEYLLRYMQAMQRDDFDDALLQARHIKTLSPDDPTGYALAIKVHWLRSEPEKVVYEVLYAEKEYHVRSLNLYQEQAKALYVLGGYTATYQVFQAIETLVADLIGLAQEGDQS